MGWNVVEPSRHGKTHPVLTEMASGAHAYFVHSFAMRCENPDDVLATADYGGPFAAVVGRDNMIGTQFHPEKSQAAGLNILGRFLGWDGRLQE